MKKSTLFFSLILPVAFIVSLNQAEAKNRGYAEPKNQPAMGSKAENAKMSDDCKCSDSGKDCKCSDMSTSKHDGKKMKNKGHWFEKEKHEISEDYDEAVYKIEKSQLSPAHRDILKKQAMQNRDLMLKQANEKADMMMEHKKAVDGFRDEIMKDKSNRKAVKEVEDIL